MKITTEQIKNELEDLRYFYIMEKTFKEDEVEPCKKIADLIGKYSKVLEKAPAKFQGYFKAKCRLNLTNEKMAKDWKRSVTYVKKLQSDFYAYLLENLNKEESK